MTKQEISYMDNVIRCSISLVAPEIVAVALKYRGSVPPDSRVFPKYTLEGDWSGAHFFTYVDGKMQGKKREYVSSDGYRILYITKRMLKRYHNDSNVDRSVLETLSDRWCILDIGKHGGKLPRTFDELVGILKTGLVEHKRSKANHPPVGVHKYSKLLDSMEAADVKLSEYRLP